THLAGGPLQAVPLTMPSLIDIINNSVYAAQAVVAVWAVFCALVVWRRIRQLNFRSVARQDEFLDELEPLLAQKKFDDAVALCEDDPRAIPQLTLLAVSERNLEPAPLQQLVVEHFQRDV